MKVACEWSNILPNNQFDLLVSYNIIIRRRIDLTYWWISALGKACHSCVKAGCLQILQCVDTPTQLILTVFDWVQIRRYGRPWKNVNVILCQKLPCNQVWGLALSCWKVAPAMEKWYHMRTKDIVDITRAFRLPFIITKSVFWQPIIPSQTIKSIPFQHPAMLICAARNRAEVCHQHD